jgi:hypothetical protein
MDANYGTKESTGPMGGKQTRMNLHRSAKLT